MRSFVILLWIIFSLDAQAGGVSGGGGNAKPNDPVTAQELLSLVRRARLDLTMYFHWYAHSETGLSQAEKVLRRKLFGKGLPSIVDRLAEVRIEERLDGPCYDSSGQEVDASAQTSPPQRVCLSIARLKDKLLRENYEKQTLALLAHEYFHLVGATESEAEFLQQRVLARFDLYSMLRSELDKSFREDQSLVRMNRDLVRNTLANFDHYSWDEIFGVFETVRFIRKDLGEFGHFFDDEDSLGFCLLNGHLLNVAALMNLKAHVAWFGACTLSDSMRSSWPTCRRRLDDIFLQDREISYPTLRDRWGGVLDPGPFPNLRFRKVSDRETARLELVDLLAQSEILYEHVQTLARLRRNR
jgi:hypothetical protein